MKVFYALLAAASLLSATPALAAPSICWAGKREHQTLKQHDCDVSTRRNANNHIVHDVTAGGLTYTVVLWGTKNQREGDADFIYQGGTTRIRYWVDDDGDIRLASRDNDLVLVFRFPGNLRRPPAPGGGSPTYSDAIREALFQ